MSQRQRHSRSHATLHDSPCCSPQASAIAMRAARRAHLGAQGGRQAPQHGAAAGAAAGVPAHVHALAGQQRGAAGSARGARADGRIGKSDLHGFVVCWYNGSSPLSRPLRKVGRQALCHARVCAPGTLMTAPALPPLRRHCLCLAVVPRLRAQRTQLVPTGRQGLLRIARSSGSHA